jgi:hypothetical protein
MNNISDTIIRKKISIHAKILASILLVELGFYAVSPVFQLPSFLYSLFPVWIWGKIAITNGPTYMVTASILLLIVCVLPLFIWGHAYPQKEHYGLRLRIWYILFSALLGYTWLMSMVIHITAISPPKTDVPLPPGVPPLDYEIRDLFLSQQANTPPVHSIEFVLFLIVMLLYTAESFWIHRLLTIAKRPSDTSVDEIGNFHGNP